MSKAPLTTIPRETPGRPRSVKRKAELLIGTAGVDALATADLHIVSGSILRELTLILKPEPSPEPTTTQPEQKPE